MRRSKGDVSLQTDRGGSQPCQLKAFLVFPSITIYLQECSEGYEIVYAYMCSWYTHTYCILYFLTSLPTYLYPLFFKYVNVAFFLAQCPVCEASWMCLVVFQTKFLRALMLLPNMKVSLLQATCTFAHIFQFPVTSHLFISGGHGVFLGFSGWSQTPEFK